MKMTPLGFYRITFASLCIATIVSAQNPEPKTPAAPAKVAVPFREDFAKLKAGELMPDFALQNVAGHPARFSDFAAGKIVVLGLFGGDAGGAPAIMAQWEPLWKKYQGAGVVFLGIGSYISREEFDQWRTKNADKFSFPVAFDPVGKYPAAPKPRAQMTPDEIKAETARYREFFAKTISQLISGVTAPYPTTIVVDANRKLVGWTSGTPTNYNTALANLLLRAGVKLAAADRPDRIYTHEETKSKPPAAAAGATRTELLKVGAIAPDFTTIDLDGKPVKLSDFRGKVVVLDFWATWCGPCIASMPHTNEVAAHYKDQDVVVLGSCTSDARAAFEKWVKANREKYPDFIFTHDSAERTSASVSQKLYGVNGIPQQFVIDREGKIVALVNGYLKGEVLLEGALAQAGLKVDPAIVAQAKIDQAKRDASR